MIISIKRSFENLLYRKNHKAVMFTAILYLAVCCFTLMALSALVLGYLHYTAVKVTIALLIVAILFYYKKSSRLRSSVLFLIILLDIDTALSLLSDEMYLLPTFYPFIALAGFFYFFDLKGAICLSIIHYLYWALLFFLAHRYIHPENPLFSTVNILDAFVTSVFILTFSVSYYFSTRRTYMQIQKTDRENENILKEIYHRITNNLNFLASVLGLQIYHARKNPPKTYGQYLTDTRLKIDSIAMIHGALYEQNNIEAIHFEEYLHNLTQLIKQTYSATLPVTIDTDNLILDPATANRLGIILNELLINTIKHTPLQIVPEISVSLKKEDNNYTLKYHEKDGKKVDPTTLLNSKNIGMRLIRMIATEQLEGEIGIVWKDGLVVKIVFPV